ncbi:MAG: hypothetical protein ACREP7_12585 [Lysobacter sp.]
MKHAACLLAVALASCCLPALAEPAQSPWGPSNNPMNGAGVAHNAYLGCLLARNPNGERSMLEVLVYDCGLPVDGARDEYVAQYKDYFDQEHTHKDKSLAEDLDPYRSRYSPVQFSYFEAIDRIFATAANLDEVGSKLAALENQAVASLARSETDLSVLGAVSVSRASLQLCKTRFKPGEHLSSAGQAQYEQAMAVVGADVKGYTLGYAQGGGAPGASLGNAMQMSATASALATMRIDW